MVFHSELRGATATIGEVQRRSAACARAFHALGLRPGDVVAIQLPSWIETAVAYHAVFALGGVVLPITPIYGPAEVAFILRQSRARMLIQPRVWRGVDYPGRFAQLGPLPDLAHRVVVGGEAPAGAHSWDGLASREAPAAPKPDVGADQVCILLYTSGTTAAPKGVKHTHNTFLSEIGVRADVYPTGSDSVDLNVWPAGHLVGLMSFTRPFLAGERTVFMDRWAPEAAAQLIERHRVTRSSGTPIFLSTLLRAAEEGGHDLSSLESFGLGGASVRPDQIRQAEARGFTGARSYGSTEHPSITRSVLDAPFAKRAHTDGAISGANEVRILDDAGRDLPAGREGEIVSRGPELFVGYVDEGLDRESFLPGGWYRTGDIGRLDPEGFLTITDRAKDIIIRGGENISSREVEEVLARCDGVAEVAVTALPDERYGEKVCAFVTLDPGASLTLADVDAHFAAAGVARQKTPERLVILPDLPRTPSGKIKKFELRAALAAPPPRPSSTRRSFR